VQNILIIGSKHIDRINYAITFAQTLLCLARQGDHACKTCLNCKRVSTNAHPNIIFIEPKSAELCEHSDTEKDHDSIAPIKIEQVRRIIEENQKANFEYGVGIFIITHMHKTTAAAANALLKVIEENHPLKIFLALAPSRMAVLKTIASRMICHTITPAPLDLETYAEEISSQILSISKIPPKKRFLLCKQFSQERAELLLHFEKLSDAGHIMLRGKKISHRFALLLLESLKNATTHLKRNLNPRLTLEQLLLREWPFIDDNK
jgi:hypothetical protein